MARPRNLSNLPQHPAVNLENIQVMRLYTTLSPCAEVTCPACGTKRWYSIGVLRQQVKRPTFTGACRACGITMGHAGTRVTMQRKSKSMGRYMSSNGYVQLGPCAVSDEDLPLYRAMTPKVARLAEHRFVVAKHLGRPLHSYECIDHMNGIKTDNAITNLRIYVRGKNQPGSCTGYGTYYHEWQMAEKRIRELEALLQK